MKNRKVLIGIASLLTMAILGGCSLAKEEGTEVADATEVNTEVNTVDRDRLVGVFLTEESLDRIAVEEYISENASDIVNDTEVIIEETESERVYATIDKNNSDAPSDWEIHFEGIEGIFIACPTWIAEEGHPFRMLIGDDMFCDVNNAYFSEENGYKMELTSTIYVLPQKEEIIYYENPIYQTPDGDIYFIAGRGICVSNEAGMNQEGMECTSSITEDMNTTVNNMETATMTSTVTLRYVLATKPTKITVYQMDEANEIIVSSEYEPGKILEEIQVEEKTAYVLVETEHVNLSGEIETTRIVYDASSKGTVIETLYAIEGNFLMSKYTTIIW